MESLNQVFTEEQVTEVSGKILKTTIEKIDAFLSGTFYDSLNGFLYEHYQNVSEDIHSKLVEEITEEFIREPKDSRFAKLREKLFNENKELLVKTLTDEAIEKSVEDVIEQYTHRNYYFNWRWKDAIVRIIGENWDKFKDDERVNSGLLRENAQLKDQITRLQKYINDMPEPTNSTVEQ